MDGIKETLLNIIICAGLFIVLTSLMPHNPAVLPWVVGVGCTLFTQQVIRRIFP